MHKTKTQMDYWLVNLIFIISWKAYSIFKKAFDNFSQPYTLSMYMYIKISPAFEEI